MSQRKRIAIVGGGIAGLAAAYRLQDLVSAEILLFERLHRCGGVVSTERRDGFILEAGPDSFLSTKPAGLALCEKLGIASTLQGPDPAKRGSFVLHGGRLFPIPEGLTGLVPSRLEPLLDSELFSNAGKQRLLRELDTAALTGNDDESLASFVSRRFGREVYDYLIEPLMAGIYAGDGEDLSLAATFPQLRVMEREHGSVVQAISESRSSEAKPDAGRPPAFLAPASGMQAIVDHLEMRLRGIRILYGTSVQKLERDGAGFRLNASGDASTRVDAVILATPAHVSADLASNLDRDLQSALAAIPYSSTALVTVAYPRSAIAHPLDGYGYLVPRAERKPILACTWVSSKFPDRAPPGFGLLRYFVGRAGQEEVLAADDAALLAIAKIEARDILGAEGEPVLERVQRWLRQMPQYTSGHLQRLETIQRRLQSHPRIALAGSAYRGVGIPDCILSGQMAAERIAFNLRGRVGE